MSIFGSLGAVSAGFKTLVACFSFRDIEGAKILGNIEFEPQGENLSLIMVEAGKADKGKNTGRYVIKTRMDELIKELNIDKNRITGDENENVWDTVVEKGKEEERNEESLIISCTRQSKGSDGCWMRNVSSRLHVEWKL